MHLTSSRRPPPHDPQGQWLETTQLSGGSQRRGRGPRLVPAACGAPALPSHHLSLCCSPSSGTAGRDDFHPDAPSARTPVLSPKRQNHSTHWVAWAGWQRTGNRRSSTTENTAGPSPGCKVKSCRGCGSEGALITQPVLCGSVSVRDRVSQPWGARFLLSYVVSYVSPSPFYVCHCGLEPPFLPSLHGGRKSQ